MIAWCQGEWITLPDAVEVAAIHAGPSLFETFAVRGRRVVCLDDHLMRMASACSHLDIDPKRLTLGAGGEAIRWSVVLNELLDRNQLNDAIVRLLIVPQGKGLAKEWLTARSLPPSPKAFDLYQLHQRRDEPEWHPRPKSGPWNNSTKAWHELRSIADRHDAEGVQWDMHGCLCEGTRSSFAWWDGVAWNFPASETGRLLGTAQAQMRNLLIQSQRWVYDVSHLGFPYNAHSFLVLRSTLELGAVPARSYYVDGQLVWSAWGDQTEASYALQLLAEWRAQRSVSFA